jgi:GMP synthase (glutamine-hydrolysing)
LIPQITVLDAGGQYCHLIARKVRELGVYAEVASSETPASELKGRKGIIISGGPSSVYDEGSPTIDPAVLASGIPVLGICYGHQLVAHLLGGTVTKGDHGEYGFAQLEIASASGILNSIEGPQPVWMSHRDLVSEPPQGFSITASTSTCAVAAMGDATRKLYGVQFHPEVAHTPCGKTLLANFVLDICGCQPDWDPKGQVARVEQHIREVAGDRNIFFFVSGGVDSTVAYTLCLRALGPDRVHGTCVDTGMMREGEIEFVRESFQRLGAKNFAIADAREQFLKALEGVIEPEQKRHIIGQQFVEVQEAILAQSHYLDGHWILGQGTIYPDTIESKGSAKADLIKTHHNRVAGIQKLIDEGRIVEPLASFYKDEVRAIGTELGIDADLLERHPFPGPGLAIRCLCTAESGSPVAVDVDATPGAASSNGWILPIKSVGVQGDSRTYRPVLALAVPPRDEEAAAALINRRTDVNRIVGVGMTAGPVERMKLVPAHLTAERLDRLRRVDAIVRDISHKSGFDQKVWQFPVVLIPLGFRTLTDSVVLRPIESVDGMTARAVRIPLDLLGKMVQELMNVPGIAGVFYDLTNKPPGTIEWE